MFSEDVSNNLMDARHRLMEKTRGLKGHPLDILEKLAHENDPDLLYLEKCARESAEKFRPYLILGPNDIISIRPPPINKELKEIYAPNPCLPVSIFQDISYNRPPFSV